MIERNARQKMFDIVRSKFPYIFHFYNLSFLRKSISFVNYIE